MDRLKRVLGDSNNPMYPNLHSNMDRLKQENEQLIQKLNDRTITIENAGSIAEASLKLNKVFEAAQKAADDYLESIKSQSNGKTNAKRKRKK